MERKYYLLAAIIIVIAALSTYFLPRVLCESKGGIWESVGLSVIEECILPTPDAGKECSDRKDCVGPCLVELTEEERERYAHNPELNLSNYTKGKCAAWTPMVGCQFVLDGGKASMICID